MWTQKFFTPSFCGVYLSLFLGIWHLDALAFEDKDRVCSFQEQSSATEKSNIVCRAVPLISPTPNLKKLIKQPIKHVERIDFTGDGVADYILKVPNRNDHYAGQEYWVSSAYKILKKTTYSSDFFDYRWFVNLDADPELEYFEAYGWEDGGDYFLIDQNLRTGKDQRILYYNPVIIENDGFYWGYPWDVTGGLVRRNAGRIEILSSFEHMSDNAPEDGFTNSQKRMPTIFFHGHHTQESDMEKYAHMEWRTLDEVTRLSSKIE